MAAGDIHETEEIPNVVVDATFFRVSTKCPTHKHDLGLGIRFYFDPLNDSDYEDILIPEKLIRPFLVGGFDAVCLYDEDD